MNNLIKCKACGKEIAKGVNKCIHCGKDQRNFFMKHKVITGIIALFIIGGIGNALGGNNEPQDTSTKPNTTTTTENKETKKEEPKIEVTITAPELIKAYEDNEVNADKNYKDKLASITGKIDDIGVAIGQTYIVLSSEKDFALTEIQCFFEDKVEIDKIANLKKGDKITIEGKIDGKSLNVIVKNCKIK